MSEEAQGKSKAGDGRRGKPRLQTGNARKWAFWRESERRGRHTRDNWAVKAIGHMTDGHG
jgi:hypothetical protein